MRLLLIDTETTGLGPFANPPQQDAIIEIGAVLWCAQESAVIAHWSDLIAHPTNAAEDVNHISPHTMKYGLSAIGAFGRLKELAARADYCVAHNSDFDRTFLENAGCDLQRKFICSKNDIVWPGIAQGSSLIYTAVGLGVPVTGAHRALTDCLLLARCFERVVERGHDVKHMIKLALRPKKLYEVADKSYDAERNKIVKAAGFSWTPENKSWRKKMLPEAAVELAFEVREVTQ